MAWLLSAERKGGSKFNDNEIFRMFFASQHLRIHNAESGASRKIRCAIS